jgi:hypothetical protein
LVVLIVVSWGGLAVPETVFGASPVPLNDKEIHMGVASCDGSNCHTAAAPLKGVQVLQNEYRTWSSKADLHSQAYQILLNEDSKRIARNLGIGDAHKADLCLDCHANNVPESRQGRTFQIDDGVTCEACHGGAGRWIGSHIIANASHENNISHGLYPTDNPVSRARLCLSCHFGDEKRFVTHRIMGAGHPRMNFELDTFTKNQPAHFKVDADYRQRKGTWNHVQTWAIGQAMSVKVLMTAFIDPKRRSDGIFPELVFFDCHACHHPMSDIRWQGRESVGLGPGIPRISDSNLLMLRIISNRVDSKLGNELKQNVLAIHAATRSGNYDDFIGPAKAMKAVAEKLVDKFASHKFSKADMQALLKGIIAEGMNGEFVDYAGAEQAAMGLSSVVDAMVVSGAIKKGDIGPISAGISRLYELLANDEAYKFEDFKAALRDFGTKIPG